MIRSCSPRKSPLATAHYHYHRGRAHLSHGFCSHSRGGDVTKVWVILEWEVILEFAHHTSIYLSVHQSVRPPTHPPVTSALRSAGLFIPGKSAFWTVVRSSGLYGYDHLFPLTLFRYSRPAGTFLGNREYSIFLTFGLLVPVFHA